MIEETLLGLQELWGNENVFGDGEWCWEILGFVNGFSFLPPFTCNLLFIFFLEVVKEWMTGREGIRILLITIFFGVYDYFRGLRLFCKRFPEPLEIALLPGRGVWRITGIIFGKLWIWDFTMYVCIQSVCSSDAATSRRHHPLLRLEAFIKTCAPTGNKEKKKRPLSRSVSRFQRTSFSLAPGNPSF